MGNAKQSIKLTARLMRDINGWNFYWNFEASYLYRSFFEILCVGGGSTQSRPPLLGVALTVRFYRLSMKKGSRF